MCFEESPLENQIDRDRILADESLKREFRAWLLDPEHLAEFDRGTMLIPEKFLAADAIAPTPVGFEVSNLQPEFGLVQGEGADPRLQGSGRRGGAEEGRRERRETCKTSVRSAVSSGGSTTSPVPDATRPAASAAFIFPASTGWRQDPPIQPSCRPRRISSATRFAVAISCPHCATADSRIIPADFPAGRNCAAIRNSWANCWEPNMMTDGARIAMPRTQKAADAKTPE